MLSATEYGQFGELSWTN